MDYKSQTGLQAIGSLTQMVLRKSTILKLGIQKTDLNKQIINTVDAKALLVYTYTCDTV